MNTYRSNLSPNIPDTAIVLKKALFNASEHWNLSYQTLSQIIGKSAPTLCRIANNPDIGIDPHSKEGELGLLFIRAFRSLNAFLGNKRSNELEWLTCHNHALNGVPITLMENVEGLARVVRYLDAIRGKN